jgi:hypothetical protein
MTKEIKPPVIIAIIVAAILVLAVVGYRASVPPSAPRKAFVFTKLSDLVKQQETDPSKLTKEQKDYLKSLPPAMIEQAKGPDAHPGNAPPPGH